MDKTSARKIIHIDMDAFYASVEQHDNPELKGKPVAVGGSSKRGVVAAASYEARAFGVRSAMSSVLAARKCPGLIFVRPRFDRYKEVSNQIRAIFFQYTDLVEPLSLDEAYLDVTYNKKEAKSAIWIANQIRKEILQTTGLTASAGVSVNKFVAKVASDINKPNGIKVILPDEVIPFLEDLPIEKFHGIGKVTAQRFHNMGIRNGKDLKRLSELELLQRFGKVGRFYYRLVRGKDDREVKPNRIRKSIGVERTFNEDIAQPERMLERLVPIAEELKRRMDRSKSYGRTLTLKIKYADFQLITRSKTLRESIRELDTIHNLVQELLYEHIPEESSVRLLGIYLTNLEGNDELKAGTQLKLDLKIR